MAMYQTCALSQGFHALSALLGLHMHAERAYSREAGIYRQRVSWVCSKPDLTCHSYGGTFADMVNLGLPPAGSLRACKDGSLAQAWKCAVIQSVSYAGNGSEGILYCSSLATTGTGNP